LEDFMQTTRSTRLGLLGATLLAGSVMLPAGAAAGPRHPTYRTVHRAVRCDGAIQHPIRVKATALDPLRRGEIVRVRVITTSRHGLDGGEVRLVSTGGAELASTARVSFGRLSAGREAITEFAVRLPAQGQRFLLQFRVTGEGTNGLEARGATLNLLPDGLADPGRAVTSDTGERIVEYRARRIDP
jgi:hypothetical protein